MAVGCQSSLALSYVPHVRQLTIFLDHIGFYHHSATNNSTESSFYQPDCPGLAFDWIIDGGRFYQTFPIRRIGIDEPE
jgi:hypothetical protein